MSEKKIIAVVGATGAQGVGLVRAITADKDGPFTARSAAAAFQRLAAANREGFIRG
jgi:thiamine monophosphate synthase